MSAKKKSAAKDKRRKDKAKRKAAQKARYISYKESGQNSKSKRNRQKAKKEVRSVARVKHPISPCGNLGCLRCNPLNFSRWLNEKGKPVRMPQHVYAKWIKTQAY